MVNWFVYLRFIYIGDICWQEYQQQQRLVTLLALTTLGIATQHFYLCHVTQGGQGKFKWLSKSWAVTGTIALNLANGNTTLKGEIQILDKLATTGFYDNYRQRSKTSLMILLLKGWGDFHHATSHFLKLYWF